ncbi:2-deoxy-D-gluconate 3-dehydrogenase [Acuticoccus sediminis]|uniref:2-deoxy-D-gluconate 3-dehydrogenase n=1 Tax=Acuticoccus sediminis TaxID=2184697 RepID=A0A8B2P2J6_9HYPH|nr:glucose 1-dehydrogenase [Acuticoccus sediminis]RAI04164.1 2-deoxy-D-gluconate 3-dehydrogenase [Acuticoccus sediminis]
MELSLEGKVALVTGASSGLGANFAKALARSGASLVLAARRLDRLEALRDELATLGTTVGVVAMDVTDTASIAAGLDAAASELGTIDVVVNNAGVSTAQPALDVSDEDWSFVIDTNLTGCFTVAREAAQRLKTAQHGGSIINIASITGLRPAGALVHYASAKAGLIHMTKVLALEWARYGIRVNAICPGYIETDINREFFATDAGAALVRRIPQRRLGQPDDLSGALCLLASDASAYMTGSVISIDGGHLCSSL